jgi:chemotaxis protein methyltransferase CheR
MTRPPPKPQISDELLKAFQCKIASLLGLSFTGRPGTHLRSALQAASRELEFSDSHALLDTLLATNWSRRQQDVLATHLTIGETYFCREPQILTPFSQEILPPLIQQRREQKQKKLRFWSAGCSTGEEAYTIGILLMELLPDFADWQIEIVGTDLNPVSLEKAAAGQYRQWSFRQIDPRIKKKYFHRLSVGQHEVIPELKSMVRFAPLNLVEPCYPSRVAGLIDFDAIFCRNVLMYFLPPLRKIIIERFHRCLRQGGTFLVSPCETSPAIVEQFTPLHFARAVIYQKGESSIKPPATFPPPKNDRGSSHASRRHELPVRFFSPKATVDSSVKAISAPAPPVRTTSTTPPADTVQSKELASAAKLQANRGCLDEALTLCQKALLAHKLDASLHYLRASILLEQGEASKAGQALNHCLYLAPDFILAHFTLGNLHRQQNRDNAAQKCFRNALNLLNALPAAEILPESEGISAGNLTRLITNLLECETVT